MLASLKEKRVLVTAGSTQEPIDPVRYLSNRSSGKQGYAIAEAFCAAGAEVVLISGRTQLSVPKGVIFQQITTAEEMLNVCENALPVDIAVCAAAVCDWRAREVLPQKMKKQAGQDELTLHLVLNPDILARISWHPKRPPLVIGFAAETGNLEENARRKLQQKGCDWILANDVSEEAGVFGGERNTILKITKEGATPWPTLLKKEVAVRLVQECAVFFS